jgi:hemerythrin-like domain-containing protein
MDSDLFRTQGAPSFDDPLGMLTACHGRIARQLDTLERLLRHLPENGCDRDAQLAARNVLRYFDTAAVNHHADEEASVFPRLLARVPGAAALIGTLEADHERLAANWRRLRPLLASIAAGERATLEPKLVHEVRDAYQAHIEREETALIPQARAALPAEEIAAIGREMAARRSVAPR